MVYPSKMRNPPSFAGNPPPSFAEWKPESLLKPKPLRKSPNKPLDELSFADCHGNNEGSETTPERKIINNCGPSPGVINTNCRSQQGNVVCNKYPKLQFPDIQKHRYIPSGTGGYTKNRKTRKKSKKSAKHIKKIRKTISNKKNKKK